MHAPNIRIITCFTCHPFGTYSYRYFLYTSYGPSATAIPTTNVTNTSHGQNATAIPTITVTNTSPSPSATAIPTTNVTNTSYGPSATAIPTTMKKKVVCYQL